jgi:prepilin-type N-terminal cleavage/methylation domain-containing protein
MVRTNKALIVHQAYNGTGMTYRKHGFSIVEVLTSAVILAVIVLGASSFKYGAVLQEKQAAIQEQATRTGLYLLQSWQGTYPDPNSFDPSSVGLSDPNISTTASGPAVPSGFTQCGAVKYRVSADSNTNKYFATLCYKDVNAFYDSFAAKWVRLRILCVVVDYSRNGNAITSDADTDAQIQLTTSKQY